MLSILFSFIALLFIFLKVILPIFIAFLFLPGRSRMFYMNNPFMNVIRHFSGQMRNYTRNNSGSFFNQYYNQQQYQHGQQRQSYHQQANTKGIMTRHEALDVLGLSQNASEADIKEAYQKLIKMVHPDRGGSPYLTQKLNQAKEVLLG